MGETESERGRVRERRTVAQSYSNKIIQFLLALTFHFGFR